MICFAHLGNGMTVYDNEVEVNGDYIIIPHIDRDRNISYRKNNGYKLTDEDKSIIEDYANYSNPSVSYSQPDIKVFSTI